MLQKVANYHELMYWEISNHAYLLTELSILVATDGENNGSEIRFKVFHKNYWRKVGGGIEKEARDPDNPQVSRSMIPMPRRF